MGYHTCMLSFCNFMTAVMVWIVYSQMFNYGSAQYHAIDETNQLWKSCIGVIAGSFFIAFPGFKTFMKKGVKNHLVLRYGLTCVFIAMLFLIRWESTPPEALYYVSQIFFSGGLLWTFATLEAFFSEKITVY